MASKWSGMANGNTKKVENIFTTWPDKSSILDIIKSISLSPLVPLCCLHTGRRYMDGHIKKNFIMWNGHLTDTWGFIYYGRAEDGQTINIRVSSVLLVCTAQRERRALSRLPALRKNEGEKEKGAEGKTKLTGGSTSKMLTLRNFECHAALTQHISSFRSRTFALERGKIRSMHSAGDDWNKKLIQGSLQFVKLAAARRIIFLGTDKAD